MYTDITGPDLTSYRGSVAEPDDFDDFWRRTLTAAREHPIAVQADRVDTGLTTVDTYDVSFAGWDGQRIAAWLTVPAGSGADAPLPAVVEYIGYGGGRGLPTERLLWASAGVAHLLMDTRGQGSGWATGDTPDPDGSGPAIPGVMTRGIESPETYYYRRLTTDAVRAVDAARATAPAWFSVALMDPICPPSTVYAAYNAWAGPKEITVWEYNGHEGGGPHEDADTLPRLRELFG